MQPFGAGLGCFERQSLQTVGKKIFPGSFRFFGFFADPRAGGDDEKREMVAMAVARRKNVIAQAEFLAYALALEVECVNGGAAARSEKRDRVSVTLGFEELPHGADLHEFSGFALDFLHSR